MKASVELGEGKYNDSFEEETKGLESITKLISESIQNDNIFSFNSSLSNLEIPKFNFSRFQSLEIKDKILMVAFFICFASFYCLSSDSRLISVSFIPIFSIRSPRDLSYCALEIALRSRNKSSVRFCRRNKSSFFSSGVKSE